MFPAPGKADLSRSPDSFNFCVMAARYSCKGGQSPRWKHSGQYLRFGIE